VTKVQKVILGGAIIGAFVVVALLWQRVFNRNVRVKVTKHYQDAPMDAFQKALVYEIPDQAFESLVQGIFPKVNAATPSNAVYLASLLKDSAALRRTNYARILMQYGADVEDAIAHHTQYRDTGAVAMLLQLRAEAQTNSPALDKK
jgi:hypothetical protein